MVKETKIFGKEITLKQAIAEMGNINGFSRIIPFWDNGESVWEVE